MVGDYELDLLSGMVFFVKTNNKKQEHIAPVFLLNKYLFFTNKNAFINTFPVSVTLLIFAPLDIQTIR